MQQIIIGRVTANAAVKTTSSGKEVVNFSIAVNQSYKPKNSDTPVQTTTFFNCSYWLNTSIVKVLRKDAIIQVEGRISARPYTTNTGDLAASLDMFSNRVQVLVYAKKEEAAQAETEAPKVLQVQSPNSDDLPF